MVGEIIEREINLAQHVPEQQNGFGSFNGLDFGLVGRVLAPLNFMQRQKASMLGNIGKRPFSQTDVQPPKPIS